MRIFSCLMTLFAAGYVHGVDLAESFSGPLFPPEQWTRYNNDAGLRQWQRGVIKVNTAPACAAVTSESQTLRNDDWLITRRLFPMPGQNELLFWVRAHNSAKPESLELWVSTAGCAVEDFTHLVGGFTTNATAYQQRSVSLARFDSTPVYFAFRHRSRGQRTLYLDDVTGPQFVPTDVGVSALIAPATYVPPDTSITPRVVVKNFGGERLGGFSVGLAIIDTATGETAYAATAVAETLDPQATLEVGFAPPWRTALGGYLVVARTGLAGDMEPRNDTLAAHCTVVAGEIHDVAAVAVIRPAGLITAGPVTPCVEVQNLGNVTELFPVILTVLDGANPVYLDTVDANLAAGTSDTVLFADWTAMPGVYTVAACTELATDINPANDTAYGQVEVIQSARDVGVAAILAPIDTVTVGDSVLPLARVVNYGSSNEAFDVLMRIGAGYLDTAELTLAAGAEETIDFDWWFALVPGEMPVACYTVLAGDENPENDTAISTVVVLPAPGQSEQPGEVRLGRLRVLPTPGSLRIQFQAPAGAPVDLRIYDATGRLKLARSLVAGNSKTEITWNRTSDEGGQVPAGVYLLQVSAAGQRLSRKLVLF
uniref:T9SS type A sorting domain-containing protein n=1 Tax=candidate division WOR-3 bacterium TaxID=2052148 RepID=A0A7C4GBI6_UNCW3